MLGDVVRPHSHRGPPSALEVFYFDGTFNQEKLGSRHGLGKDSAGTSGRSAREATGKFKEASKMRLMNCTRGVAGGAAAIALVASLGAQAADPASCKEVSSADGGWTDITAKTAAPSLAVEGQIGRALG